MENMIQLPELKIEAKKLPSRGLSYPEGTVFSYTNYTFGDYHAASNSDSTPEMVLKKAMEGIKSNSPMKIEDLSIIDLFAIGLTRRLTSQKSLSFEMEHYCEKCKAKSTIAFTSTDVKFECLSEKVTALPAKVKVAGKDLHFGLLTVRNALDASSRQMKVKNKKANSEFSMLALTVKNMPFEEAYTHLQSISEAKDFATMEKLSTLMYMEINPLKATCKNVLDDDQICGHENLIDLEGKENLIRPCLSTDDSDTNEIRFGDT